MLEKDAEEIAKDIYIHHFDDDINYPDVLKAITVGVQKDGNEVWIKKDDVTKEFLGVMVEYLKFNNNDVVIAVSGKPKFKITLEEIKE